MAPLHHHFELSGWKETQVVVRFWIITMMLVLVGLVDAEDSMTDRALVLGLGECGLAMARWLDARGYSLRVADTRDDPPRLAELRAELPQAEFVGGEFVTGFAGRRRAGRAQPGPVADTLSCGAVVKAAQKRKIEVVGEIELFARALDAT